MQEASVLMAPPCSSSDNTSCLVSLTNHCQTEPRTQSLPGALQSHRRSNKRTIWGRLSLHSPCFLGSLSPLRIRAANGREVYV